MPTFSAKNNWEAPRCVKVIRGDSGYGFLVRGSKPVRISGVDKGSGAEVDPDFCVAKILACMPNEGHFYLTIYHALDHSYAHCLIYLFIHF